MFPTRLLPAARVAMRNEIQGLSLADGKKSSTSLYTVLQMLVNFLAGAEIDIDNLLTEEIPDYWEQSVLIAKNPAVAAKFLHTYTKAFISSLL